ncbi:MAG: InlB B-repeat-containing protein, partial [Treponema sp.]|nr:InlB B-repeat-containing protein [Treponema sp.]
MKNRSPASTRITFACKYIFACMASLCALLLCVVFATCQNPIMERWWEDRPRTSPSTGTGGSGVNFAVVFLDANGGSPQPEPLRVLWGSQIPRLRSITHPNPVYGFGGWIDENGAVWDMNTRAVRHADANDDGIIILRARWAENIVTVNFQTNFYTLGNPPEATEVKNQSGVPITVNSQKISFGGTVVEPPVIPRGDGQGLVGWFTENGLDPYTKLDRGDAHWGEKWNFAQNTVSSDMTLYARWSIHTRTVHLQINGGTRSNGQEITRLNFTVYTGLGGAAGGKIIDPGPMARDGHTFGGWFTNLAYTDEWKFSTSVVYGVDYGMPGQDPFTLFAKWVPNIYFVTFIANGGIPPPATQNIVHGERVGRPPAMSMMEM